MPKGESAVNRGLAIICESAAALWASCESAAPVTASQRVRANRGPMTGYAKLSHRLRRPCGFVRR